MQVRTETDERWSSYLIFKHQGTKAHGTVNFEGTFRTLLPGIFNTQTSFFLI